MTQRIHKVLLDSTRDHFAQIESGGKPLNLNAAAQTANPRWPAYTEVCIEAWELYPHEAPDGSHQQWVLRAQVRCCCAGACHYAEDHAEHDSYAKVPAVAPSPGNQAQTPHGPAQGYVEATIGMSDLAALAAQAKAAASDVAGPAALGKVLSADAARFGLIDSEIAGVLGVAGDAHGLLQGGSSAVYMVMHGESASANDYYCVAAFMKLWQRLVHSAHQRLAMDWPQRGVARPIRLGQRIAATPADKVAVGSTPASEVTFGGVQ